MESSNTDEIIQASLPCDAQNRDADSLITSQVEISPLIRNEKQLSSDKSNKKSQKNALKRTRWHNDGPNGSVSSLSVLLDWISTQGNYSRWKGSGEKQTGQTKYSIASEIAAHIQDAGIKTIRKSKDIMSKISSLEQSYREAVDFLSNTGSGITDEKTLQEAIISRCPYYDILKEVMQDRPSSRPLLTNEDEEFLNLGSVDNLNITLSDQSSDGSASCKRKRVFKTKQKRSIRSRSSSTASTISSLVDINNSMIYAKKKDHEVQKQIHSEHLELKKMQFHATNELELRKIACKEDEFKLRKEEMKHRVVLLQAQVEREKAQSQCEIMLFKMELARNRKQLRDEGVPQEEIDTLLPISN